ncbi:MAG: peptidylprolyl isomerase [Pseudomonadota bacterium]
MAIHALPKRVLHDNCQGQLMVIIETNHGDIHLDLNDEKAPISVENFFRYLDEGYFNDTIFHRVIPNFMIQGGGMDVDMNQKPTHDPIKNEADNGLPNVRGSIAMARTNVVDSATSQFFINLSDNSFLDHGGRDFGYAVFGKVTQGMDIVDTIAAVKTGNHGGHGDVPVEPVKIISVRRDG